MLMIKTVNNAVFFEEVARILLTGQPVELRVRGNSMMPYLRNGKDKVALYPAADTELKKGRIVLFRYRGNYLLHRIIKRNNNTLLLQGDGVYAGKEQVAVNDVVGVVKYLFRSNDKRVSVQSFSASCYWRFWLLFRPFRRILLPMTRKFLLPR